MKWVNGRQKATQAVRKLTLVSRWFFDCHILNLPAGAIIGAHTDVVTNKRHTRLNITLKGKWCVIIDGVPTAQRFASWHVFRPDIQLHSATVKTNTYVLSIGVAL